MEESITCFHYTNDHNYMNIESGLKNGRTGLVPYRNNLSRNKWGNGLPHEAYDRAIFGLLEPEPHSWTNNPEYPDIWWHLMHDICKYSEIILLSLDISPRDKAFIAERGHLEEELYKDEDSSTSDTKKEAAMRYFKSKVPLFEYAGGYEVPEVVINSPIDLGRIKIEWRKDSDVFWERVLAIGRKNNA